MSSSSPPFAATFKDNHGISYQYGVLWALQCVNTVEQQEFHFPLDDQSQVTAEQLFEDSYRHCKILPFLAIELPLL